MKAIKLIVILVFLVGLKKQTQKIFTMQEVVEKPSVDTLIDKFLKMRSNQTPVDTGNILITIITRNGQSGFSVFLIDSVYKKTIFTTQAFILNQLNFRYFKYQRHHVFICGDADIYNLFQPLSKNEQFNIQVINNHKKPNDLRGSGFLYVYKNGKFKLITNVD